MDNTTPITEQPTVTTTTTTPPFSLSYSILKKDCTSYHYADMASWCNSNGALIEDAEDSFRIVPVPPPTESELLSSEISDLEDYLASTDYMAIKCGELGLSMASEYPEEHVKRQQARDRINEIRGRLRISL